jgi:hypothetical protein
MYNKLFQLSVLFLLAIWQPAKAQQTNNYAPPTLTPFCTQLVLNNTTHKNSRIVFTDQATATVLNPATHYNFHYVLPKGAIFCRMEDALYKHFNFWIKFRMGNDDRYSD